MKALQCCGWKRPLHAFLLFAPILSLALGAPALANPSDPRWSGGCLIEFRGWQGPGSDGYDFKAVYFDDAVHRYALENAQTTPEYRFGVSPEKKRMFFQFLAPCAQARKTFSAMHAAWRRRNPRHVNARIYSVRPATAEVLQTIQFHFYKPRFWRRDCIVGLFPIFDALGNQPERGRFLDFLLSYVLDRFPDLPLLHFSGTRGGPLFVQFYTQCDRRIEIAREFVEVFAKRNGGALPFRISERVFEPGPDTMEHGGAEWLDHYFPVPRAN